MRSIYILTAGLLVTTVCGAQYKGVQRTLEPCECQVKTDSSLRTQCAYMLVPENRRKKNSKMIRVPFIRVYSKDPNKKPSPLLSTAGGPGSSSLRWASGAPKVITDRDCIAFEQRGTYFARPRLSSSELDEAIKQAYRNNLDKDSMMIVGTKRYRAAMEKQGIDLGGYNTDETVADITDLLVTLGIDSVNLVGGSYSGGLMMAVLKNNPDRVRSLVLDSPLPVFVPIDEDEPMNFMESMDIIFDRVAKDSTALRYVSLKQKFVSYFNSIKDKTFYVRYLEPGAKDSINVAYNKNDLLDIISGNIYPGGIANLAGIVADMVEGKHETYMREKLRHVFKGTNGPSAMRISVYCADQTAYHSEKVLQSTYNVYPFLRGFRINDVYKEMCDCWNSPAIQKGTKEPFYSAIPALLADGIMDNACRPLYIDRILHYLPNSQRLLFTNRAHMTGGDFFTKAVIQFLNNPFQKIVSDQKDVIAY